MLAIRNRQDFAAGAFFVAVAALVYALSTDYPMGSLRSIGPGFLPIVLAAAMALLGLTLILRSFAGSVAAIEGVGLRPLVFVLAGSLSFGLLVRPAGVLIALIVLVMLGCAASREIGLRAAVLTALGLAVGSIAVFVYGLGLPLPVFGYWFG